MNTGWISLEGIPRNGCVTVLEDQAAWEALLREFSVECRIVQPVRATMNILPQENGVLFRGRLEGVLALPCNRCSEDSLFTLEHSFDCFEPFPLEPGSGSGRTAAETDAADAPDEAVVRLAAHGRGFDINPQALAWEEFSLALPIKPLCAETCRGLCPECGVNRNQDPCDCGKERVDPRLAALAGLIIEKKKK